MGRNLPGDNNVAHEDEAPARQMRTVTEIEVLGQCVGLPATGLLNASSPPHAAAAAKAENQVAVEPSKLFNREVTVNGKGLAVRQQVIVLVKVSPAGLDHANLCISQKIGHCLPQERRVGDEIGIENCDKFAVGVLES